MMSQFNENENGMLRPCALSAGLYLVATPIGNLRDISLRALDVLRSVDVIACEDTRVSGKLLKAYDIQKPLKTYHDHSDGRTRQALLSMIAEGKAVALISDAGMPLISDPGYKLVRDCRDLGLMVTTIPGANAVLSAVQLSSLPSDRFSFIGFLPSKEKARRDILMQWKDVPSTLVAYEAAPRLLKTLRDIALVLGGRDVAVVREVTKIYEESRFGAADDLVAYYEEHGAPKGEIVVVMAPPEKKCFEAQDIDTLLLEALREGSVKDAAAQVAEHTGLPRKNLYTRALELK